MESRISPLQDDALNVLERPGVHVPRTLKMKAFLYTGGNFRKKILRKIDRKLVTYFDIIV